MGAKLQKLNQHKASGFYSGAKKKPTTLEDSLARGKKSIPTFPTAACH